LTATSDNIFSGLVVEEIPIDCNNSIHLWEPFWSPWQQYIDSKQQGQLEKYYFLKKTGKNKPNKAVLIYVLIVFRVNDSYEYANTVQLFLSDDYFRYLSSIQLVVKRIHG